jgi:hypothetical protein
MELQAYTRRVSAGEDTGGAAQRCRTAVHDTESLTRSLEDSESVSQSLLPSWRALTYSI